MTKAEYHRIEVFMREMMTDSAHDPYHIYRVLYAAMDIAETEKDVNPDILITACLLHDIGRTEQSENLELCHAEIGGEKAYTFLLEYGWSKERAGHVRSCILTHRFRRNRPPESIEAKILFDADKLDATGAIGIGRTLLYSGQTLEPLYVLKDSGDVLTEETDAEVTSFFQEFNYKLRKVYDKFYTARAKELASSRKWTAMDFYEGFLSEVNLLHRDGQQRMKKLLED